MFVDHAAIQKGNNGETAAENEGTRLGEEGAELREQCPIEPRRNGARGCPMWSKRHERGGSALAEPTLRRRADQPHQHAAAQEQPDTFRFGPDGEPGCQQVDRPQQLVPADILGGELPGADRNDADHRGTDAVERSLHPWEATVAQVSPPDGHYHEKGWQDERNAGHCGAHDSVMHVPEIHRELRGQRTGHELRQRQSFLVVLVADPVALLDEIAIHVTDERDRTTKADAAELQEVARKLSERVKRSFAHCDDRSFAGRLIGVSAAEKTSYRSRKRRTEIPLRSTSKHSSAAARLA